MPGNFKKNDLRVEKTLKAMQEALLKLLGRRNFGRITVNELCEEAQISRPTFYAHFKDKYDLLEFCLTNISEGIKLSNEGKNRGARIERAANQLIRENAKAISNLVKDANDETLDLLYAFMLSLLDIAEKKDDDGNLSPQYIVFSNFCTGGMMKLLSWQVDNKFPQNLQWISTYFISLITHILAWKAEQDHKDEGEPPDDKRREKSG